MANWNLPWEGGCRCGELRFRVTEPPMLSFACHCRGCQLMSGSAFSLTLTVPAQGFALLQGEPVIGGLHGPDAHHHHCDRCKSWVFTRAEGLDFMVNVRATLLDEPRWFRPFVEVWTSEGLPWAKTGAAESYETSPDMDGFQALVARFAAEGVPRD
ncbi:MAG TPA: GFA family protein [Allosphingosinicella sp.]|jgi:hypothetical protein